MGLFQEIEVSISAGNVMLQGQLLIPGNARGMVIFSHGSGSNRFSPRNLQVAQYLQGQGFGTLLTDLLTQSEDLEVSNRFDMALLTHRVTLVTGWLEKQPLARHLPIGYFGASTGAASALKAAARNHAIAAVVSRGGRPDLAMDELHCVMAPTLLIAGSLDSDVLRLNQLAFEQLKCIKKLEIIPGASHLFAEPGMMHKVSELAAGWYDRYLTG